MKKIEYPKFNRLLLKGYKAPQEYKHRSPVIKNLLREYQNNPSRELTSFENEYLIKNFRFKPFEFGKLTLEVGKKTEERIQKEFNISREVDVVKVNTLHGETDEFYHVSYKTKNNETFFWLYKDEIGDLYEKINLHRVDVNVDELNEQFEYTLKNHQITGVAFLKNNPFGWLLDTTGAGKTHTSIAATISEGFERVLVVCICGKELDWKKELKCWGQDCKIITGTKGWIDTPKRYTIIHESLIRHYHKPKGKNPNTHLLDEKFDCIIVDEVQKFRSPKAKKSKVMTALSKQPQVKAKYLMSATPIEKNEHFYNICRVFNTSVTDLVYSSSDYPYYQWSKKFDEFVQVYCGGVKRKRKAKNGKLVDFWLRTGDTNTHELHQRFKHMMRRRRTEKVVEGFPEKIHYKLYAELSSVQQRKYDNLYEEYAQAKRKAIAKIKDQDERAIKLESFEKAKHLVENIQWLKYLAKLKVKYSISYVKSEERDGKKCLIFTNFVDEIQEFEKKLPKDKTIIVKAGLGKDKKQKLIDEFQNNDKIKFIVGNIKSIGTGFNITVADVIHFNSPLWESDEREQGIGRSWRIGREKHVIVSEYYFEGTKEEEVQLASLEKQINRANFFGEIVEEDDGDDDW